MIVIAVIGGLIILGLLILAIPIDLFWVMETYGQPRFSIRWSWLFGLVSQEVPTKGKISKRKRKPFGRKLRRINLLRRLRNGGEYLQVRGLASRLLQFTRQIMQCLHFEKLEIDLIIGLGDPAETFYLFALGEPFQRWLNFRQPFPVKLRYSFSEPMVQGYSKGSVKLYPIQLAQPVLQLIFSRPAFRVLRKVIRNRWQRKRSVSKPR